MERVYDGINNPDLVPLGIANPCMAKPAAKSLHRAMKRVMSRTEERSLGYSSTLGEPALRRQIAYHYHAQAVRAYLEQEEVEGRGLSAFADPHIANAQRSQDL